MAETLISPGVLARENDQTFVGTRPVPVGTAIIGPTIKGPVEVPTLVTTWSEYNTKFGTTAMSGSADDQKLYSYFTSIAAYNYFTNGGNALLVTRVASGSFSPATSSLIPTGSGGPTSGKSPFVLETFTYGNIMNSTSTETAGGVLPSGSKDNVRWQIANANSSSGTFDLFIRRGDDSARNPVVLETWPGLSLDPLSSNYISRVIGDIKQNYDVNTQQISWTGSFTNKSNYVIVKEVNFTTPNFIDANGDVTTAFTGSIPINASGTFGDGNGNVFGAGAKFYNANTSTAGNNTQGLVANHYTNSIALLTTNKEDYKYNVLLTPGLFYNNTNHEDLIDSIITNTQNRGDSIYVPDLAAFGSTISNVTSQASKLNTSYAAAYWPWLQVVEPSSGEVVWVPASTMIGGVYAFNDSVAEPWFAPAGINRGGLSTVVRAEQRLSQQNRDTLYAGRVNPIATFPGTGTVVYGQKTLQAKASALDRVNVRRLLIALKSYISNVALGLVFEQNTAATRNGFLAQVNPYLASVQQRQGLYAFKVIMDDSNNSADVIDRNEMYGQIYLQPTKTAEFIYLDFNITPTGASFPA
jgi:phage tail sheath protein FI